VHTERSLSIRDLEKGLVQHSVVCALQCAGNRRHTMRTKIKEVSGIDWFDGAVMNCIWTGPLLCDVLKVAGTISTDQYDHVHVAFGCHSTKVQEDDWYVHDKLKS
jgi:sulfite oxidase